MAQKNGPSYDIKLILALSAVALVLLYGSYSFYKSWTSTEEDQIKKVLTSLQKSAAKGDSNGILDCLTPDFRDHTGNGYDEMRRGLNFVFVVQKRRFLIKYHQINIQLAHNKKNAKVFLSASRRKGKLDSPSNAEIQGELTMVKKDGKWLIRYAKYQGIE